MRTESPSDARAAGGIDLPSLWQVAWRYRIFIASATLLCGAIAVALALLAKPVYRAATTITMVENQSMGRGGALLGQLGGLASLAGVNLGAGSADTRDAKVLLESRHLIEEFILRNKVQAALARNGVKPTLWKAADTFENNIVTIDDDPRKGKTTVTIDWTDPAVAAQWANGFVALANEMVRARALASAQRNIDYLNKQLAQTNVVDLQKVMYNIIEQETKTLMLANAQPEYAFAVLDPAVAPEVRFKPKRTLIVIIGLIFGSLLGTLVAFAHNTRLLEKRRVAAGH